MVEPGVETTDLAGIRILDFSPTVGGLATSALADMGAAVIHVGRPTPGGVLESVGRNKRSIALNLKSPDGRRVAHALAARADVVIEGFRPGVAARLGIDAKSIHALNPSAVYCSLSGYGQDGPYSAWAGHDLNYQGVAGSVPFDEDGRPEMPDGPWSDRAAGFNLQIAVLRGLVARELHGVAPVYDVALVDATATIDLAQQYSVEGVGRMPTGGLSGSSLPKTPMIRGDYCWYGFYRCADGHWLSIACLEPQFWAGLCAVAGHEEWSRAQFDMSAQPAMRDALEAMFASQPRDYWLARLTSDSDLPVAPVHRPDEAALDPHLTHRGVFIDVVLPGGQPMRQLASPSRGSRTDAVWRSMTVGGMDSVDLLNELGWRGADIERLLAAGVVQQTEFPASPDDVTRERTEFP